MQKSFDTKRSTVRLKIKKKGINKILQTLWTQDLKIQYFTKTLTNYKKESYHFLLALQLVAPFPICINCTFQFACCILHIRIHQSPGTLRASAWVKTHLTPHTLSVYRQTRSPGLRRISNFFLMSCIRDGIFRSP